MSDPYCYPGTTVLKNIPGLRDPEQLARFERLMTYARMTEPLPPLTLDVPGYRAIHRHVFQDVYAWAGELRRVDIAKGQAYFGRTAFVPAELAKRFALLQAEANLHDPQRFAACAAVHAGEINALHPFREGNGRALRLFLKAWAHLNGHDLAIGRIDRGAWHAASVASFMRQDYAGLEDVIAGSLAVRRKGDA